MEIQRQKTCSRFSDVVIYNGEARWVEVPADNGCDARGQIEQIVNQIDETLLQIGSSKDRLLEVVIYLHDLGDIETLNTIWDAWVDAQNPPIRACVQAGLQNRYSAEFLIRAAV